MEVRGPIDIMHNETRRFVGWPEYWVAHYSKPTHNCRHVLVGPLFENHPFNKSAGCEGIRRIFASKMVAMIKRIVTGNHTVSFFSKFRNMGQQLGADPNRKEAFEHAVCDAGLCDAGLDQEADARW